jgi:hypothetical protein
MPTGRPHAAYGVINAYAIGRREEDQAALHLIGGPTDASAHMRLWLARPGGNPTVRTEGGLCSVSAFCVTVTHGSMRHIRRVRVTTIKTLVCLANSRKLSGRCVAGIVYGGQGVWIRPVSARPDGEVSEREQQYKDGSYPRVLDIVSVPLLRHQPDSFQSENWLLDPWQRWEKIGRIGWAKLLTLEQQPETL